jgi:hypothetical protein
MIRFAVLRRHLLSVLVVASAVVVALGFALFPGQKSLPYDDNAIGSAYFLLSIPAVLVLRPGMSAARAMWPGEPTPAIEFVLGLILSLLASLILERILVRLLLRHESVATHGARDEK